MFKKVLIITAVLLLSITFSDYAWSADRGTINSGETKVGFNLTSPSYMDTWTFQGNAGDRVIINAITTSDSLDTTVSLYPPGGSAREAGGTTNVDKLDHQLQQSGLYTIVVEDWQFNDAGAYNLTFLKIPGAVSTNEDPDGGAIASGETLHGIIAASDMDAFQFYGDAGDRVIINAITTSGSLDTTVSLYPLGGSAREAGGTTNVDKLDHQLQQSGLYTIVVEDWQFNDAGAYNLTFLKIPGAVSSSEDPDGGAIASGETSHGIITVSDMDAFQFYGNAGDRVIINAATTSGSLDTTISLYPLGGSAREAGGTTNVDKLDHQLQQSGLYTIVVEDWQFNDAGEYNVSLSKIPSDLRPGIYNPSPQNGSTVSNTSGSFSWDVVVGGTGYDLYFGEGIIEPLVKIGDNLSVPSMPFPTMENGGIYYWHVVAHTTGGDIQGPYWWFAYSPVILPSPIISGFTPTSGPVGTAVSITGNHFTTTPVVKFNGITAPVTNATDSLINTVVPAGATTGPISVTTSGGTATSGISFTVTPTDNSNIILSEDFEDGILDPRILIETVGTFSSNPGIINITNFGSSKAFGYGKSTCGASCFNNFITNLKITFTVPTYVSTISFREMELYDNWGSGGKIYIDGNAFTPPNDPLIAEGQDFGRKPLNDRQADTTYRTKTISIDRQVSLIEIKVVDITNASEIFIDDLIITSISPTQQYTLTVGKTGTGSGTVTSNPAGINCGNLCSSAFSSGAQVTLTATADSGSTFTNWSGCDSTNGNQCTVTMNNARSVTAIFSLIQTGTPKMSVSPRSLNFGSMKAGASAQKMVTISNSGTGQLLVNSINISGTNAAEFSQTNNCTAVASKGACTITVTFNPTLPFGKKVASLTITSNNATKGTISINLSGQASASKISVKPSSLSFGTMVVGGTPVIKTVKVFNKGLSDLMINSVGITGTNASEFSHTNDCGTVQAGGTCTVSVTYTPNNQTGKKSALLVISSNDPKKLNLNIKLTARIR